MSIDERLRILKMVEEGKLTAEEAAQLLAALQDTPPVDVEVPPATGHRARWLRIRVHEANGKAKVNIKVPLKLVKWGLAWVQRYAGLTGQEMEDLSQALEAALTADQVGPIVEVEDLEAGERVEIVLE